MSTGSSETKTIGIILPAFNEGPVIGQVLDRLPRHLNASGKKLRTLIIVVNDGSSDNTALEVAKRKGVTLISHVINCGAGAATRTGLHYALESGCSYAVIMDSDGQHSAEDVKKLIGAIANDESDLIIGSRLKQYSGNMPLSKRVGNKGLSFITFLLLGVYASDTQSGLRAFSRQAMGMVEFHSNNYAHCSEMLWKAHQAKLRISEVPIEAIYTDYSVSRGQKNLSGAYEIIRQLIRRRLLHIIQ